MSRSRPSSPDVHALLEQERAVPPLPAPVRARAIARARAALLAGRVTTPAGFNAPPRTRWGVVLAVAGLASAAAAATAYELGTHHWLAASEHLAVPTTGVVAATRAPSTAAPSVSVSSSASPPVGAALSSSSPASGSRPTHSLPGEPSADELGLLGQARAAVARRDFAGALGPIAEHARRFRGGRLAEEREALRVRALSGLGRTDDARRAADAFAARFPHSVLLPAVSKMPASAP